jgi:hypothetical protein
MSLHQLANQMKKKGRGSDTMLVHMSPREVGGLQQLAKAKGGSLTINPSTGLPEAGFLEDILPVVAAAAATYFTGGAAAAALGPAGFGLGATTAGILGGAGAGALIGGASSAIQGGDFGQGALMGGVGGALGGAMGAFPTGAEGAGSAGAGLNPNVAGGAPGLSAAAPAAPTAANAPLAQATTVGVNPIGINPSTGMGIDPLKASVIPPEGIVPASYGVTGNAPTSTLTPFANQVNTTLPGQALPGQSQVAGLTAQAPVQAPAPQAGGGDGISGWWAKQSPWEKAGISTAGALGLAALNAPPSTLPTNDEEDSVLKRISPNFRAQQPVRPNPYYRAQYPVYASGGIVALAAGGPLENLSNTDMGKGMYPQGMIDRSYYATPSQMPSGMKTVSAYDANINPMFGTPQSMSGGGGIADLGSYSDGGRLLKGPGDGMSDNIPAVIGKKQPARLADGEFVIPADVVSGLGNGSTNAGAKKLYAMMDKVRTARTGKKKQAPAVNTDRFIPRMA